MDKKDQNCSSKEAGGIIISPSCECNCLFCGLGSKKDARDIKKQKINALKNLKDFKNRGIKKIEISGADPVEYDEICELIKFIRKVNFGFVQLSTHGMRLNDDKFLKKLIGSGVTRLRVPVYGSTARIHDSITRKKGSFVSTYNGLKKLLQLAPSIEVQVSCLIMQQNKNDLIQIIDLIKALNVDDFYFSIPCVSNGDFSYAIPYQQLSKYTKKIVEYCKKTGFNVSFLEMPYCVFEEKAGQIYNQIAPPDLGDNCQPHQMHKTDIKDLPKYRLKTKMDFCEKCAFNMFCDGFFVNYIEKFGIKGVYSVFP